MNQDTTPFEKFFSEEYGITFIDVTPQPICPMTINCGRMDWSDGATECEGCGLQPEDGEPRVTGRDQK